MKRINKRTKSAISALMALVLIAATWAYFASDSEIDNELSTGSNGVETIEEFTPKQKIEPGSTIKKSVGVKNTGDSGLVVRIKLEEAWARSGTDFINISSEDAGAFNDAIDSAVMDSADKVTSTQTDYTDGDVAGDESVMYKKLLGLSDGTWTKGDDGYYYYNTILAPKNTTSLLLDSLTFAGDADLGVYINSATMYSTTASATIAPLQADYDSALAAYEADLEDASLKADFEAAEAALESAYAWTTIEPANTDDITYQKTATSIDPSAAGYAEADYTLTVITQVCQATEEAVDEVWPGMDAAVKAAWGLN